MTYEQRLMRAAVRMIEDALAKLDMMLKAVARAYVLKGETAEEIIQELEEKIRE